MASTVTHCGYDPATGACPRCGEPLGAAHWIRNCPGPPLLGTRLARLLAWMGITRRRWTRWTTHYRMIGGVATARLVRVPEEERTCNCGARELLFNRLHAWLRGKRFPKRGQ